MQLDPQKTGGDLSIYRLKWWHVILVVLFFGGLGTVILYPDDCPSTCKVAMFANSDEVTEIVARAQLRSSVPTVPVVPKAQGLSGLKNKHPIPVVAASVADGQGNVLIVSEGGVVTILVEPGSDHALRCTVIHPKVDARWCALKTLK